MFWWSIFYLPSGGPKFSAWTCYGYLQFFLLVNGRAGPNFDFPSRTIPGAPAPGKKSPLSCFLALEVTDEY